MSAPADSIGSFQEISSDSTQKPEEGQTRESMADIKFADMSELKEKAPTYYKLIMDNVAQIICTETRRHKDRMAKLLREGRRGH